MSAWEATAPREATAPDAPTTLSAYQQLESLAKIICYHAQQLRVPAGVELERAVAASAKSYGLTVGNALLQLSCAFVTSANKQRAR